MKFSFRGVVLTLGICLFLSVIAWAYRGDFGDASIPTLRAYYPFPGSSYPIQYLPILANMPAPTATARPPSTLHVGLNLRWDGAGHINIDSRYWNPGTHETRIFDQQVDGDTVRATERHWYSPNPFNWPAEDWYCHYNTNNNRIEMCSASDDPAWRWGYYRVFPADVHLESGKTAVIDGQTFNVSGPHTFLAGYGEEAQFWRLVNRDRFLYHSDGSQYKQYVEAGDAVLFYSFDEKRFLLFSNVKRTYYKNDNHTSDTVRYEARLTGLDGLLSVAAELSQTATQSDTTAAPEPDDTLESVLQEKGIAPQSIAPRP